MLGICFYCKKEVSENEGRKKGDFVVHNICFELQIGKTEFFLDPGGETIYAGEGEP